MGWGCFQAFFNSTRAGYATSMRLREIAKPRYKLSHSCISVEVQGDAGCAQVV